MYVLPLPVTPSNVCLPKPLDQEACLPGGKYVEEGELCNQGLGCEIKSVWEVPTSAPSVQWKQPQNL